MVDFHKTIVPIQVQAILGEVMQKENDNIRLLNFTLDPNPYCLSSLIVEMGRTKVLVTVSSEDKVPSFIEDENQGWVTAEYSMLPSSTHTRGKRERKGVSGRSAEIQRLIGRSLRSIIDLKLLGPRTLTVDCDVLVADGGTRTASITGAVLALHRVFKKLIDLKKIQTNPLRYKAAAVSVGMDDGQKLHLDLDFNLDSKCVMDANFVLTEAGEIIEIQATSEKYPLSPQIFEQMQSLAHKGIKNIIQKWPEH